MWVMRGNTQEWLQGFWPGQLVNVGVIYYNGKRQFGLEGVESGAQFWVLGLSCQVGSGIYQSGAEGTGLEWIYKFRSH